MNRKEFNKKFWKLKQLDRIEYKIQEKEIKKKYVWGLFFSKIAILGTIIFLGLTYCIIYFYGNGSLSFKETGELIFRAGLRYLLIGMIFDVIFIIFGNFFEGKEIKKLNKRFKL